MKVGYMLKYIQGFLEEIQWDYKGKIKNWTTVLYCVDLSIFSISVNILLLAKIIEEII